MLTTATPAALTRAWNRSPGSMTAPALASIGRLALSSPAIASNDWPRPRARPKSPLSCKPA
jgi:hypothetical protein